MQYITVIAVYYCTVEFSLDFNLFAFKILCYIEIVRFWN